MNPVTHLRFMDGYRPRTRPITPEVRLGQLPSASSTQDANAAISPPWYSYLMPWGPAVYYGSALSDLTIPGSSVSDLATNATTGNLTTNQVQQIQQQAATDITAAGGTADDVQQAMDDIAASVAGNVACDPGMENCGGSTLLSSIPVWAWLALGVGGLLLVKDLK